MIRKLLVIGLALAGLGLAQGGKKGGGGGGNMGGSPAPMAGPNKFEQISTALNLTKDQKKAAKTILDDGAKDATPLRDQVAKTRIAVADAIQTKKNPEEINQATTAAAAVEAQLEQLEMKTFAKIYSSLDENQKANKQGVAMAFTTISSIYRNKNWNED